MNGILFLTVLLASSSAPKVHALIVANNQPTITTSGPSVLSALRYADDDGARYYELLSLIGSADILSVLDAPSQSRFPDVAREAGLPTRKEIEKRLDRIFSLIREEELRGERTIFYFVFVGHGSVGKDGQGALHLTDGLFSRSDLFQLLIARSPASINHIIIDACNAYLMVLGRGDSKIEAMDAAIDDFLEKERLDHYPNTGVLVSTSRAAEVHEWARFEGGVFSHEVRSALAGAADVDENGRITYDEIAAFVAAANGRVRDPRAKLDVFASPPAIHRNEPLFLRDLAHNARTLRVPRQLAGRYWLEDARGVRYADFHMSGDLPVTMTLVPSDVYFLRDEDEEMQISFVATTEQDAGQLAKVPAATVSRGAEDLTFRQDLFAVPFGRAWYEGYRAATPEPQTVEAQIASESVQTWSTKQLVAVGVGGTGVLALATGAVFGLLANAKAGELDGFIGSDQPIRKAAQDRATVANVLYIGGATLVTSAIALWFWPEDDDNREP